MGREKIKSIQDLRRRARQDGGLEVFILLNYGVKSVKHISHDGVRWHVENYIDSTMQVLDDVELKRDTNIIRALEKRVLIVG